MIIIVILIVIIYFGYKIQKLKDENTYVESHEDYVHRRNHEAQMDFLEYVYGDKEKED